MPISRTEQAYIYHIHPAAGYAALPVCLFCPSSTTDELARTTTDESGFFSISVDTTSNYISMFVGNSVYYTSIRPGLQNVSVVIDAYESSVLRETLKVTEGDTAFTVFNMAQPNEHIGNSCYYIDDTGKQCLLYPGYSTGDFVDTLQLNFEIDANTF